MGLRLFRPRPRPIGRNQRGDELRRNAVPAHPHLRRFADRLPAALRRDDVCVGEALRPVQFAGGQHPHGDVDDPVDDAPDYDLGLGVRPDDAPPPQPVQRLGVPCAVRIQFGAHKAHAILGRDRVQRRAGVTPAACPVVFDQRGRGERMVLALR